MGRTADNTNLERELLQMKKSLLIFIALVIMFSIVMAGCANGNNAETGKSNNNQPQPTISTPASEGVQDVSPVELKMLLVDHPVWPYNENWPIYKYIKEETGVSFNAQGQPGSDYDNVLNLTIASGDIPDIVFLTNTLQANRFGAQGAFVNILDYLDDMPSYKAFLDQHTDVKESILSADGSSYLFPNHGLGEQFRRVWQYREDIFQKHDLKVPANYDELYVVAKQLQELYPDSYPINFYDKLNSISYIVTNFGTWDSAYYDHSSKQWKYGPTEDNFKTMLEYLHTFHSEGLIPPDFMSMQRNQSRDLFAQDKSFITADFIGIIDEYKVALADKPEFQLAYMPPLAGGANGEQKNPFSSFQTSGFAIASTSKNIDAAIRYFDYLYSQEGIELVSWGREGETYVVENGKKKIIEDFKDFGDLRVKTGMVTNGSYAAMDFDAYLSMASDTLNHAFTLVEQYETLPQPRPALNDQEIEIMATIGQSVRKHYEENIAKFIIGSRSLSEWDQYVTEANKLGTDKIVEVYTNAYNRVLDN